IALKGWILEQTSSVFDRTPPLRGKWTDLGRSFRHPRDEAAIAIDDAGEQVAGLFVETLISRAPMKLATRLCFSGRVSSGLRPAKSSSLMIKVRFHQM